MRILPLTAWNYFNTLLLPDHCVRARLSGEPLIPGLNLQKRPLVTGQFRQAQFEWFAHEPMARKAGVSETTISAIKSGAKPEFEDHGDAITYAIARKLHQAHELSDNTY